MYIFLCVVTFEYSERKLLIGQFDLTHVKQVELKSPDMFENRPWLPTGCGGMFFSSKLGQNLSEMEVRTFVRIHSESNLGPLFYYQTFFETWHD